MRPADIFVRLTGENDIAVMIDAELDEDTRPWLGEVSAKWHQQALVSHDMRHLTIMSGGDLAGFVVLAGIGGAGRRIELRRIVVERAHRGRGIGRLAMAAVLDRAFGRYGARQVWLDVKSANDRARACYEKAGFIQCQEPGGYIEADGTRIPLVVMSIERDLDALAGSAFEHAGVADGGSADGGQPSPAQALRIAVEIEAALGVDLRASDVGRLGSAALVTGFVADCLETGSRPPAEGERGPSAIVPLSHAQERLLLGELAYPGGSDTFLVHSHLLTGPLDLAALRRALADVISRHPALRTILTWDEDGSPGQVVLDAEPEFLGLEVTGRPDLADRGLSLAELGDRLCGDWWHVPFQLESAPFFRARVVTLSPDQHVLCLAFHQLAVDSWSTRTVASDLGVAYVARCGGDEPSWPPTGSYRNFVWWERWQQERCLAEDVRFWRQALDGRVPLPLGPLGAGPPEARCGFFTELPAGDMRPLMAVGRRERLAVLLHSAAEVLSGYAGERCTALGTLVSGRAERVFHQIAGSFVNVMMVPADLDPLTDHADHLDAMTRSLRDCLSHSQTPFDEILRALPRAGAGRAWPGALVVLNDWFGLPPGASVLEPEPTVLAGPSTTSALMLEAMVGHDGAWQIRGRWRGTANDATGRTLVEALAAALLDSRRYLP